MSRRLALAPRAQTALLAGLGVACTYAALMPLRPGGWQAPPDLIYCLVLAWTLRSPAAVPVWIVVALGLFGDVMLARPIGLGALGLVLAVEAMAANAALVRGNFVLEWLAAAGIFALMLAGMQVALRVVFADPPGVPALVPYVAATALAYPVVVLGLVWGVGLRAPRLTGAGDRLGRLA